MLPVALGVLTIIGIVLLALLGLLLLTICLVLFVPVRYRAGVAAQGLNLEADARASWLMKLVRLKYIREKSGEDDLRIYIFWFFRLRMGDENEKTPSPKASETIIPEKPGLMAETAKKPSSDEKPKTSKSESYSQNKHTQNPAFFSEPAEPKESFFKRLRAIVKQINYYRRYPNRAKITAATWDLIKKLCKSLRPKKLRLAGEIGFDAPHRTAYLFAVFGILRLPVSGIKPNFDGQALNLDLYAYGKLSLWSVLWPLLRYAVKRPIWPLTKKIIWGKQ